MEALMRAGKISLLKVLGGVGLLLVAAASCFAGTDILTYHIDAQRTGWNNQETTLNATNVASSLFGLRATISVDEQVDAQPLIVSSLGTDFGLRDVAFIATENNTIYALDASTGATLYARNLGPAVPMSSLPGGCNNNSTMMGIMGTPVIDRGAGFLYAVTYTLEQSTPVYRIHKLRITDLAELTPSVVIAATSVLSDGTSVAFNAASQRQRPGLLEANGNIYAAFGSHCDLNANVSRGWLLGWNAATLAPLRLPLLMNHETEAQTPPSGFLHNFFLSAIWMSGYGVAADSQGWLYFLTGNSDGIGVNNLEDSAIKMSSDLSKVGGAFREPNFASLDKNDDDFGSGGLMVVPDNAVNQWPHLAVAAGKDGKMFLLNRDSMSRRFPGSASGPFYVNIGSCWCGPSYFVQSEGQLRVVASGGVTAQTFAIDPTQANPWQLVAASDGFPKSQKTNGGFMTSVSSNGDVADTAIIWAVPRPNNKSLSLVALNATPTSGKLATIFTGSAGTWPQAATANDNLVPVVANGRVYVGSYKQVSIFGLATPSGERMEAPIATAAPEAPRPSIPMGSRYFGTIASVDGSFLELTLRSGSTMSADISSALAEYHTVVPYVGETVEVEGKMPAAGAMDVKTMLRVKGPPAEWDPDVP